METRRKQEIALKILDAQIQHKGIRLQGNLEEFRKVGLATGVLPIKLLVLCNRLYQNAFKKSIFGAAIPEASIPIEEFGSIALSWLIYELRKTGIKIGTGQISRDIGNASKETGIPYKELLDFYGELCTRILEEEFGTMKAEF